MILVKIFHKWFRIWIKECNDIALINPQNYIAANTNTLFRDYFISYIKSLNGSARSRTYAGTVRTAWHIVDGLGNYKMSEINKTVLKEFINGFARKTYTKNKQKGPEYYSQSEIDKVFHLLHAAIIEASSEDGDHFLRTDFMANIKIPRSNRFESEYCALTDDEIKMLTSVVSENRMINVWILLMLYMGVRPSEALALKFSDINFENKTVSIIRTLSYEDDIDPITLKRRGPRKAIITSLKNERGNNRINYQKRTLKVGDRILEILHQWEILVKSDKALMKMKKGHGTEEYIFSGPKGQMWLYDDYKQVYKRLLQKNGLNISQYNPYRFRHNCCTRLFRLGINLKAVQLIMGDNTPDMVMRVYANLDKVDVLKGSQDYSDSVDVALGIVPDIEG